MTPQERQPCNDCNSYDKTKAHKSFCSVHLSMSPQERLDGLIKENEAIQADINALKQVLKDLYAQQHDVKREIFNAQFEVRNG